MDYYCSFILKDKKQRYVIFFPDFPGATTQGDTIQECIEMGEDSLNITIEEYVRERRKMPVPSSFEETKQKATETAEENDDVTDMAFEPIIQFYKVPDMSQKPVKVTVSFPKSTLEAIDKKAEQLGLTRSGLLAKGALAY